MRARDGWQIKSWNWRERNNMKIYTDLELQLWLAKQLEKEIGITENWTDGIPEILSHTIYWKHKPKFGQTLNVTPYEWNYIALKVGDTLTFDQMHEVNEELYLITPQNISMWKNTWQILTIAMMKVKEENHDTY